MLPHGLVKVHASSRDPDALGCSGESGRTQPPRQRT